LRKTVVVDSYENGRSWCGAFNLAGNAWEWTADWYDPELYRKAMRNDPQGPKISTEPVMERVLRGGAWGGPPSSARSARRARDIPSYRSVTIGIRLVNTPSE
jgi:formylglycine-generating enzyme required for sulfatase activity